MEIYLVGGAVRDGLLGITPREYDWVVVGASRQDMLDLGYQQVGKDFPVFLHPKTHEEYALARTERKQGEGHQGFVFSTEDVSLTDDLLRRDLTINAIAKDNKGNLIDPYGGQSDIKNKVLRHISKAFVEDPLRILRVARFAARLDGFSVAEETMELITDMVAQNELATLSSERIWKEISGALLANNPQNFFKIITDCGAYDYLFIGCQSYSRVERILNNMLSKSSSLEELFGCLTVGFSSHSKLSFLKKRLCLPKSVYDFCALVVRYARDDLIKKDLNAKDMIYLLSNLDSSRRQKRFFSFLKVCESIGLSSQGIDLIRNCQDVIKKMDIDDLVAEGLTGKNMGDAIYSKKVALIEEYLSRGF
jgi:tRNA nucleotidyltransferase (CCA-adding enzyme)